jgi:hypothetical protein
MYIGAEKEDHPTSGKRVKKKFYCKIKNTYDGIPYKVEGKFFLLFYACLFALDKWIRLNSDRSMCLDISTDNKKWAAYKN